MPMSTSICDHTGTHAQPLQMVLVNVRVKTRIWEAGKRCYEPTEICLLPRYPLRDWTI
jgi:hypothetical protein